MPNHPNSNHNSIHISKMLKRLADQNEQMNSTESPQKKQTTTPSTPNFLSFIVSQIKTPGSTN